MGQLWEWVGDYDLSKAPSVIDTLGEDGVNYGNRFVYDRKRPAKRITLSASGMLQTEIDPILDAAETPGANVTLPDVFGVNWTGRPESVRVTPIRGSILKDVQVTLSL